MEPAHRPHTAVNAPGLKLLAKPHDPLPPQERLLEAQKDVLEMIVRGDPLPCTLAALCRIVEAQSEHGVVAAILLADAAGERLFTGAAPALPDAYNSAVDGLAISPEVGTCAAAAARKQVVITRDIGNCPRWHGLAHLPLNLGLRAAWSTPIVSSSGAVLGTFGTYFVDLREPSAAERQLVDVLSRTASLAIERQRDDSALRESARRHRFLAELAAATQPLDDPDAFMATAARLLADHLEVDRCAYAPVEDERVFVITGDYSRGPPSIVGRWDVAAFGADCEQDMLAGRAYVVEDSEDDPRITGPFLEAYRATQIRAVICVPLLKGGRFTAAMAVHQVSPRRFTAAEIELVELVVARCWEALERMRIARTLRASEARYRAIVETTPECVKLVARDGTVLQMNAAGLRMLDTDEAGVFGSNVYDVIAPEDRARYRAFNESVCAGNSGSLKYDMINRDGSRRSLESTAVPLADGLGGHHQLAVTRDLTSRRQAELALLTNRARLDYAAQLSGIGYWHCKLPLDVLEWDERVKEHFFLSHDARVTIDVFWSRIHPEDREPVRLAMEAALLERRSYDVVYRTVDPLNGNTKWVHALGGTAFATDGTPTFFDGVTVDVTAQKRDQARLAYALARVQDQDRRKDEFLATLAHELRNPLAPISTGLSILKRGTTPEQELRAREMMERQLRHLVRMVDDLLDISRVTLGKVTLKRERIDFRAVLNSALEVARPVIESNRHEFAVRLPADLLPLDADLTRLAQVVANLLNNSAKYTPPGGRIQLAARIEGDMLVVEVLDNGVGIPHAMLRRVFDMFTQVGRSIDRAQGGLGIGLTLVRGLVEMHGGTVAATSGGPGQGTTVTVRLPLASPAVADPRPAAQVESAANRHRILVVDDNADAADSLAMLLDLEGHTTKVAHSGEEALGIAPSFEPDIVFLDIGLPGIDGYEVARRMRTNPDFEMLHLVALTGWGAEDDRRQALAAGFDAHLVKPVDSDRLAAALAEAGQR